jgi:hypothetical protein
MELRACYPSMKQFYDYEKRTGFIGVFGAQGNLYLEIMSHFNFSNTLTSESLLGNPIPGREKEYNGCIGRMQRNESDVTLIRVNWPMNAQNIMQGPIIGADIQAVSSFYNMTVTNSSSDIMDSFKSFMPETWTLIFFTYVLIFFLTSLIMWSEVMFTESWKVIARRRKIAIYGTLVSCSIRKQICWGKIFGDALKLVSSSILDHYSSCATIRCSCVQFKVLQFFAVLLGFYITLYFGNMIKTEMVVSQKPDTILSFEDFLKREHTYPVFNGASADHWSFEKADPSSIKGRIWARAMKVGIQKSILLPNLENIKNWIECMVLQRCALFTSVGFSSVALSNFCSMSRQQKELLDMGVLIRAEENSNEQLSGLVFSSAIHPIISSTLFLYFNRALAHGLMLKAYQMSYFTLAPDTGSKSIADCWANKVIIAGDHKLTRPDISHFKTMFMVQTIYWAISTTILISEILRHCHAERRKRQDKQLSSPKQPGCGRRRRHHVRPSLAEEYQLIQAFRERYYYNNEYARMERLI